MSSSRAPSAFKLSRRFAVRPASISGRPADFAPCTRYSPSVTRAVATSSSRNSRPRHAARRRWYARAVVRSLELLRVTAILVGSAFDLLQTEIHTLEAGAQLIQIGNGFAPGRDLLIDLLRPFVIVGG